ncbi:glycosyltransferase [Uliginosibacterium paludis]|uniref:Glycosyltransferase n=1 Tax=Uliginosibacterium paludis TaxID=1615952 RepID=A0ABV2CT60_9RHOO
MVSPRRLRILTWHVHGNYLYYLSQVPHTFIVPVSDRHGSGYGGLGGSLPWGDNMQEVPASELSKCQFDCILFQSRRAYQEDQQVLLTEAQRQLPRIYLEHDPPQLHPTNTPHPVDDPGMLLVHVTHFNALMWDNGRTPVQVIEHGVKLLGEARWTGERAAAIAVVNELARRGRRLGADVLDTVRREVPVDLVGMDSIASGGLGEIDNLALPAFMARYRVYFHPARWTSLGLSAIEAMMVGLPVVGLASTELSTVIRNGTHGYLATDPKQLIEAIAHLVSDPAEAARQGAAARKLANERFSIRRFVADWLETFDRVTR